MRKRNTPLPHSQKFISSRITVRINVNNYAAIVYSGLSRANILDFGDENIDGVCGRIVSYLQFGVQP